jgi:hypothetical protein
LGANEIAAPRHPPKQTSWYLEDSAAQIPLSLLRNVSRDKFTGPSIVT